MSRTPEPTYPLGAVSRLTGISAELLRAWERRYSAVRPQRTPGGTRRYRASDVERLRLLKAAVDSGHRIGEVARLDSAELRLRTEATMRPAAPGRLDEILSALDALDGARAQHLLALQLSALGPVLFSREVALPLLREIGERWADERMGVASEHLASGVLGAMLGSALRPTVASRAGFGIVMATPSGERHELGLQMAALTALGAGANPIYLGADLPVEDLLDAVERSGAAVLALSLVCLPLADARRSVRALRSGLPASVPLWIGGARSAELPALAGVEPLGSLEGLEERISRFAFERAG